MRVGCSHTTSLSGYEELEAKTVDAKYSISMMNPALYFLKFSDHEKFTCRKGLLRVNFTVDETIFWKQLSIIFRIGTKE